MFRFCCCEEERKREAHLENGRWWVVRTSPRCPGCPGCWWLVRGWSRTEVTQAREAPRPLVQLALPGSAATTGISAGEQSATGSWAWEAVTFKWSLPPLRQHSKHHQPDGSSSYAFRQDQEIHPHKKKIQATNISSWATDITAPISAHLMMRTQVVHGIFWWKIRAGWAFEGSLKIY